MKKILLTASMLTAVCVIFAGCNVMPANSSAASSSDVSIVAESSASESSTEESSESSVESAASSAVESASTDYAPGVRTDTDFTSEWLGLKYTLTSDMVMATEEEMNNMMQVGVDMMYEDSETGKTVIDYAKLAVVYEMMAATGKGSNVIAATEKLTFSGMTEEAYLSTLGEQLSATTADAEIGDVFKRTVAGMEFTGVSTEMSMNDQDYHQTFLLKKYGDRMLLITLTYFDDDELETLLANFSAV